MNFMRAHAAESLPLFRVMGGLAAIELFSWWPIKAYRPCPSASNAGKRYQRSGQTLDEIVFKKNPAGGYYGDDED